MTRVRAPPCSAATPGNLVDELQRHRLKPVRVAEQQDRRSRPAGRRPDRLAEFDDVREGMGDGDAGREHRKPDPLADGSDIAHGSVRGVPRASERPQDLRVQLADEPAEPRPLVHVFDDDEARRRDAHDVVPPVGPVGDTDSQPAAASSTGSARWRRSRRPAADRETAPDRRVRKPFVPQADVERLDRVGDRGAVERAKRDRVQHCPSQSFPAGGACQRPSYRPDAVSSRKECSVAVASVRDERGRQERREGGPRSGSNRWSSTLGSARVAHWSDAADKPAVIDLHNRRRKNGSLSGRNRRLRWRGDAKPAVLDAESGGVLAIDVLPRASGRRHQHERGDQHHDAKSEQAAHE